MTNTIWISMSLLWLAVVGQALIIAVLVRQVGVLYERIAPAGALSINSTIKAGDKAPELSLPLKNSTSTLQLGQPATKSQLLFFASPHCPVCKTVLPALISAAKHERSWLDVTVATDIEHSELANFVKEANLGDLPIANSEILGRRFGVSKLPYAVLIDSKAVVQSSGLINSREHLESLFIAKELGVPNLQHYLNNPTVVES